jgi:hypothetical protein
MAASTPPGRYTLTVSPMPHILHVYVELVLDDASGTEAARRYPGVAAHLLSCGPCAEDYQGLLLAAQATPE